MNAFFCLTILLFIGCQSVETKHPLQMSPIIPLDKTALEKAVALVQSGEMSSALPLLKEAQSEGLVGEELVIAHYYEGLIYEYTQNIERAIQSFERAHSFSIPHYKKWQALTAYRLSKSYQENGKPDFSRAYFNDAWRMRELLDPVTRDLELKAHKALVLEELGDFKAAQILREQVKASLLKAKRAADSDQTKTKSWLPQVLFLMGPSATRDAQFYSQIKRLELSQSYLIEVAELKVSPWDSMAERRILANFEILSEQVDAKFSDKRKGSSKSPPDILVKRAETLEQQRRALAVIDLIDQLKTSALDKNSLSIDVSQRLFKMQERLKFLAYQDLPGNELTQEAKNRERPLRTLNPKPLPEEKNTGN